jgi:hypothetical protein
LRHPHRSTACRLLWTSYHVFVKLNEGPRVALTCCFTQHHRS